MKLAIVFSLVASAAAFSQEGRRAALAKGAAAFGAAFVPAIANAAAGESPRFSVFGLVGDPDAMSEGAAYGTDQPDIKLYSPYSVYEAEGPNSLYNPSDPSIDARNKAILAETKKRLGKLPGYVDKKQWFNVSDELRRFMYETRGAARALAKTPEQKKAANAFFKSIETCDLAARRKNQPACATAATDTVAKLDAFTSTLG